MQNRHPLAARLAKGTQALAEINLFCDVAAFRAIDGFSNELFVSEEVDLSQRLRAFGKARGQRMTILHKHSLLTSSRKMKLYGHRAHIKFLWKLIWGRGRALRQREECAIWYDGKR